MLTQPDSLDKPSKATLKGTASGKVPKGGRGKSAQKSKDHKEEERKMKKIEESFDEEDHSPPPPLTLETKIVLHNWKSAKEAALEVTQDGPLVQAELCT